VTNGSGANIPTGTVSWTSDGTGTFSAASCTLDASGKCTVNYTPTAVGTGTHKITCSYGGDGKHATNTGSFDEAVGRRATATSVSCPPPSVAVFPYTALLRSVTNGSGANIPTGTVSWTSDGTGTFSAASCTLDASGKCTVNYTPTAVGTGTHKLTGSYGGDAKHATSTGSFDEAVGRRVTATNVSCTPPSVAVDSATACTAIGRAACRESVQTGAVSGTSDGTGSFSAASCTLDATGKCTVNYTPTALGTSTHKRTGSYGGDAKHATSTGSFDEAVGRRVTATNVSCTPPSVAVDSATACTAIGRAACRESVQTGAVSGTSDGTGSFSAASCTLDATGKCTVNYTPTALGTSTHKRTGSYGGDAKHATSTGSFDEAVGRRVTATNVSCTPPSVAVDSATACTATVTNGSGANIPTGTVSWERKGAVKGRGADCRGGGTGKCTVNYTASAMGAGTDTGAHTYGRAVKHATSTGSFDEAVGRRVTATNVSCTPPSVAVDSATACTATVTNGSGANIPTGTVSWTKIGRASCRDRGWTLDAAGKCKENYAP